MTKSVSTLYKTSSFPRITQLFYQTKINKTMLAMALPVRILYLFQISNQSAQQFKIYATFKKLKKMKFFVHFFPRAKKFIVTKFHDHPTSSCRDIALCTCLVELPCCRNTMVRYTIIAATFKLSQCDNDGPKTKNCPIDSNTPPSHYRSSGVKIIIPASDERSGY